MIHNFPHLAALPLLLPPFLQGAKGRGVNSKIPTPQNPLGQLPKKLRLKRRTPSTLMRMLALSARKLPLLLLYAQLFFLRNAYFPIFAVLMRGKKKDPQFLALL
jgi:hypothetical protein